ncbi:MAG TPA: class I SAM-dependent methyltransferase [Acidimicrobiales bacterium]|nr:class I SAM-dependent methyltransferase [Acidimicrobiales bacterium]
MDSAEWDARYGTDELVWSAEPNRFLVDEVEQLVPGTALDLACGEGRNAIWLAGKGWSVTAVDFSAVGLAKAERLASTRGVEVDWVNADLRQWVPSPGRFDLIITMYLHVPAPDRGQLLRRAAAALAPGGVLLVVGHDITNLSDGVGGPQDPAVLFSPEDLVVDLEGLQIERAERVQRSVSTDDGARTAIDALVRAKRPA